MSFFFFSSSLLFSFSRPEWTMLAMSCNEKKKKKKEVCENEPGERVPRRDS